ncbi:MAG: NADH-quinone oxidoreductase subunit C [Ignavibacteriaceae bacterium]|nr:NADH-quinone oxidoreductase subunit C [Ignavibacteriaceae bacterium]
MTMLNYITVRNNETIDFNSIPSLNYKEFMETNILFLKDSHNHCVNYFGFPSGNKLKLICCIANDNKARIKLTATELDPAASTVFPSMTARNLSFNMFERELSENFGIKYSDHPWLKPVRYAFNRFDKSSQIAGYPFYEMESEELHEVGVGPIHAGIIEPGHFRFICKGEQILHLEIQLGYQHRGIENLFLEKNNLLQRVILAESIAGDTTVGHTIAFSNIWESLSGYAPDDELQFVRTLALELERIAIHTGDLSAICGDVAYQLGSSVFSRLRTPIINFLQSWCGNRLAKGLIRPAANKYAFTPGLKDLLLKTLDEFEPDFNEMIKKLFHNPGCLLRFEKTGVVSYNQALEIGAVGMTAKASGLNRDIRSSHPIYLYNEINHQPIIKHHGDVFSRTQIRREEILQSINYIRTLLEKIPLHIQRKEAPFSPKKNSFTISLVEGWRGEICHCAVTGNAGELLKYKVKDPSFHNWLALALSVRRNEISDFPICNKSFNLSYSGFDL